MNELEIPALSYTTAICLVRAADVAGGIWTPGAALQGRLVERLQQHAGLSFEVSS